LDSQSEQAILNALREIAQGHTSLVIAHRLSTIVDADSIVVMGNGEIIEQGNHQQLLDANGAYKKLWETQHNSTKSATEIDTQNG
ncbi:MAG: ABC-type transport system involved in Fe-S cluster assembly fused permease/ATPase subunit, partial [Paraglaciecola sp.]